MFVFRHSERVDVTFGKQWIDNSFDPQGTCHCAFMFHGVVSVERWSVSTGDSRVLEYTLGRLRQWSL